MPKRPEDFLTDIRSGVWDGFAELGAKRKRNYPATMSPQMRPVVGTSTLTGDCVPNLADEDPVNIEDFKLDLESGRIAYALLSKIADEIIAENALKDRKKSSNGFV